MTVPEPLWREFAAVAQQRRQKPEALAKRGLRDFLQRIADEDVLRQSELAARRSKIRAEDVEEIVRRHRRSLSMVALTRPPDWTLRVACAGYPTRTRD
jgi:hypothetical protein